MKKRLIVLLLASLALNAYAKNPSTITNHSNAPLSTLSKHNTTEHNKKIVTDFYNGVFIKHQVQAYADQYIGSQYIQHNPHVPDGKAPFVDYFTGYFKENPEAQNVIKSVVAENDLVVLHVHSKQNKADRGVAIVDIFRLEQGKIVEHWDVIQDIPEQSANTNTMF